MPNRSAGRRLAPALVVLLLVAAACGSAPDDPAPSDLPYFDFHESGGDPPSTSVAACYGGRGTTPEGTKLAATLRLKQQKARVQGTYSVGRSATQVLDYSVSGTLRNSVLDVVFTSDREGLHVGGSLTLTGAELADPSGTLVITSLAAGCD